MGERSTVRAGAPVLAGLLAAVSALPQVAAGQPAPPAPPGRQPAATAGCEQPYPPVAVDGYPGLPIPEELPPVAEHLEVLPPGDADGDGRADHLTERDGTIVVAVPGGEAVLAPADGEQLTLFPASLGDLDGDGLLEVGVVVDDGQGFATVVVPGAVEPGTHHPEAVGVRLPDGEVPGHAGDQDGDGADDVVVHQPLAPQPTRRAVVSGRAILDAGPGARLAELPDPIAAFDAHFVGLADLGERHPTLVHAVVGTGPDGSVAGEVVVHTDPPVRLRTDRMPVRGDPVLLPPPVDDAIGAHRTPDGHRIVVLRTSGRSGASSFAWDLDDPCAEPVRAGRTHVVAPGEWLWRIARAELAAHGHPTDAPRVRRYAEVIWWVNRAAVGTDPDVLRPGTELLLPPP